MDTLAPVPKCLRCELSIGPSQIIKWCHDIWHHCLLVAWSMQSPALMHWWDNWSIMVRVGFSVRWLWICTHNICYYHYSEFRDLTATSWPCDSLTVIPPEVIKQSICIKIHWSIMVRVRFSVRWLWICTHNICYYHYSEFRDLTATCWPCDSLTVIPPEVIKQSICIKIHCNFYLRRCCCFITEVYFTPLNCFIIWERCSEDYLIFGYRQS